MLYEEKKNYMFVELICLYVRTYYERDAGLPYDPWTLNKNFKINFE